MTDWEHALVLVAVLGLAVVASAGGFLDGTLGQLCAVTVAYLLGATRPPPNALNTPSPEEVTR